MSRRRTRHRTSARSCTTEPIEHDGGVLLRAPPDQCIDAVAVHDRLRVDPCTGVVRGEVSVQTVLQLVEGQTAGAVAAGPVGRVEQC
jgi:hypothetical protein